jgi:hypothetical protein
MPFRSFNLERIALRQSWQWINDVRRRSRRRHLPDRLSGIRTSLEHAAATSSRPASVAWRWLGADVEAGADDAADVRFRASASR